MWPPLPERMLRVWLLMVPGEQGGGERAARKEAPMPGPSDPTLRALLGELDECWRCLDEVCVVLTPRDWSRRHGRDWIVADLPYHLACFDRELVAQAIVRGPDVPPTERRSLRTRAEVDAWTAAHFAHRPADATPEQSLAEMRASRERIRDATRVLSGADLGRPVWCPLPGRGWQTVRGILALCLDHTRSHLTELRQYLPAVTPSPDPAADGPCRDLATAC
jgi:hypothetical protein